MSFKLHRNNRITITAGDSAELDIRLFNKDSLPRWEEPKRYFEFKGLHPFKDRFTGEIAGEDSEGNPVDSEGNYVYPIYPVFPVDSEGHWMPPMGKAPQWRPKLPSGFHQLQEEPIDRHGVITIKVRDFQGNIVLEKTNDEFINTIFLDPEDTKFLDPGVYLYQMEYVNDDGEVQTIVDEAFFEVTKKFTVSEN